MASPDARVALRPELRPGPEQREVDVEEHCPQHEAEDTRSACGLTGRVDAAVALDSLQLVLATVVEREARAGDEVVGRRADEHLPASRERRRRVRDVDRDPARLVAGRRSTSPVWMPARTSSPSGRSASGSRARNGSRAPARRRRRRSRRRRCRAPRRRSGRAHGAQRRGAGRGARPRLVPEVSGRCSVEPTRSVARIVVEHAIRDGSRPRRR